MITTNFPPVREIKFYVLRVPQAAHWRLPQAKMSHFVLLSLQPGRGGGETHQLQKALCFPEWEKTLELFPLFVRLPPTYTQHERESFLCLQLSTMLQLCVPAHTQQNATEGRGELLLLSGSFILWNARLCLALLFFVCHFLINSLHPLPSLQSVSQMGDLTQRPHPSDFTRRQLQSRPRSNVLVREAVNPDAVSGTAGRWEETPGSHQTTSMSHLGHLISLKSASVHFICISSNCRNAHLCCLGNESGTPQGHGRFDEVIRELTDTGFVFLSYSLTSFPHLRPLHTLALLLFFRSFYRYFVTVLE